MQANTYWNGLSTCTYAQRLQRLLSGSRLSEEDLQTLKGSATPHMLHLADQFIENQVGCFPLPLGIAPHFLIDGQHYTIPMAMEETSVIAAASRTAKWIKKVCKPAHLGVITQCAKRSVIGQIWFPHVKQIEQLSAVVQREKAGWIDRCHREIIPRLVSRGGGILDLIVRFIERPDGGKMGVIHLKLNPVDAMGANVVTQLSEFLKQPIETATQERVGACIVSNQNSESLTKARVCLTGIDSTLARTIVDLSLFAELDSYRAATHNKGIMNGIDAVLIATGNDWRAVEAGVHAYASRKGSYQPIARWHRDGHQLIGELTAPLLVGTVGGVTRLHPIAQLNLKLLNIDRAESLSRIVAAVGLVQNLGALSALAGEGLSAGHMRLHIANIMAGIREELTEDIKKVLTEALHKRLQAKKMISPAIAEHLLQCIRKGEK